MLLAGTKLYHQTDAATANIILRTQHMKPGSGGLAGGGIYFATTPELTGHKAHKKGVILEATVALGRIHTLDANGDPNMTLQKLKAMGFDSVCIARPVSSGQEYVVYDPEQVLRIVETDQQGSASPRYFPPPPPVPPPPPRRPAMRVPAHPHHLSAAPSQSHGAGRIPHFTETGRIDGNQSDITYKGPGTVTGKPGTRMVEAWGPEIKDLGPYESFLRH